MEKTCIKCGTTSEIGDYTATTACPSCGVIFAKVEAQANLDRVRMQRAALQGKRGLTASVPVDADVAPVARKRSIFESIIWILAALCASYGFVELLFGLQQAESAPQQAAVAAMAAAWAVIPYCWARSLQQFRRG